MFKKLFKKQKNSLYGFWIKKEGRLECSVCHECRMYGGKKCPSCGEQMKLWRD